MALQVLACAEPTRDQQMREKLYDRMAANAFFVYYNIQHSDLPEKDREYWIHQGAGVAFYYWVTTRKGGVRRSKEVDSGIALFYEAAVESKLIAGFSDPLYRMTADEPERIGVPGLPKITQVQYKEYVGEFLTFLNEVLKERQVRRDEPERREQK